MFPLMMFLIAALIPLSIIMAVSIGQVHIPFLESYKILLSQIFQAQTSELNPAFVDIVWKLRCPRILMSALIGVGLSLSGLIMQSSVQNPLADPYVMGISSGASLGATAAIMLGFGGLGIQWLSSGSIAFSSFVGAMASSAVVLIMSNIGGKMNTTKLVLAGVVINMICSTFTTMIIYLAPDAEGMQSLAFWSMGSVASAKWNRLPIVFVTALCALLFMFTQVRILNIMLLGEEAAMSLGVKLSVYQTLYMAVASLVTGVIVSRCGIVGYVGLIIPHISRMLVGTDHRKLLPFSVCLGAVFMIWADVLARSIYPGSELPLGLITSAIGAPVLLYMILKKNFTL